MRRSLLGVLVLGAMLCATARVDAIEIARRTRFGYIVVDNDGSTAYRGRAPNGFGLMALAAEVTRAIGRAPGPAQSRYLAIIQQGVDSTTRASYWGMRNFVRGIGLRGFGGGETFDYNPLARTAFSLNGIVFLNALSMFAGLQREFTRDWVCPQEFGHRFGTTPRITPVPLHPDADAGGYVEAGSPTDAGDDSGDGGDDGGGVDAAVDVGSADASSDAPAVDATTPDAGPIGPQAADILLGRQRAHWSYFVQSGGSPMEGNNWVEIGPGVFRADPPTRRFSPVDLYFMGLLPASAVPPFFVIVNPDVMGQLDLGGNVINRESTPEIGGRTSIVIRGRRLTYTIDDILAANGVRDPAYRDPDAGAVDAGADEGPDMQVIWIMLTTSDRVTDILADQFDTAIQLCTTGYQNASGDRSHLIPTVYEPGGDGGIDAGVDAAGDDSGSQLSDGNGDAGGDNGVRTTRGGCGCVAGSTGGRAWPTLLLLACIASATSRRRARSRARARRVGPESREALDRRDLAV